MNPLLLGPFDLGGKIIERMFPDPSAKAAAELELLKIAQTGDLQTVWRSLRSTPRKPSTPASSSQAGDRLSAGAAALGWPTPRSVITSRHGLPWRRDGLRRLLWTPMC